MKEQNKKSNLTVLAPLLLFVIFTTCILTVLLTGADIYKKISQRDQNSFQRRTAVQYLTTRLRQSDIAGVVFVENDTLFLREELNGRTYCTRIYCQDGYLCELFSEEGLEISKKFGEPILALNALQFTLLENVLRIEIEHTDNTTETLILNLHCKEEDIL